MAVTIVVVISVAAAGWFAYQVYLEHRTDAEVEHQLGVEEMARRNAEQSLDDVIDDIGQEPAFNGPLAPDLGLAPDTTQP